MIPVYINVRNRLTTTRILADQVATLTDALPILIDNASDWPPLLDWYAECPYEVVRLPDNVGHHAPWLRVIPGAEELTRKYGSRYYAVTDCDLDLETCPADTLQVLQEPFSWNRFVVKSGLSLRIDDLPDWQVKVREWERRWWQKPLAGGRFYTALIDTTFALYDGRTPHKTATTVVGALAVRAAPPYCAKHVPWYLDGTNLDAENEHYFATANASNSWRPNGQALGAAYATPRRSVAAAPAKARS